MQVNSASCPHGMTQAASLNRPQPQAQKAATVATQTVQPPQALTADPTGKGQIINKTI